MGTPINLLLFRSCTFFKHLRKKWFLKIYLHYYNLKGYLALFDRNSDPVVLLLSFFFHALYPYPNFPSLCSSQLPAHTFHFHPIHNSSIFHQEGAGLPEIPTKQDIIGSRKVAMKQVPVDVSLLMTDLKNFITLPSRLQDILVEVNQRQCD